MPRKKKEIKNIETIRELVSDCIRANNQEFLVHLIGNLQEQYVEIAKLVTLNKYESNWSHNKLLNFITKEM